MWDTDEIVFLTCCEWDIFAELWRCWDLRLTNCAIRKVEMVIYIDTTRKYGYFGPSVWLVIRFRVFLNTGSYSGLYLSLLISTKNAGCHGNSTCTVFDIKIILRHECRTNNCHLRSHSKPVVLHLDIEDFGYHGNSIFRCCDLPNRK